MRLGLSPLQPESESSKAFNIQYPNAIDGDAIVSLGPGDGQETWVKFGGRWNIFVRGMDELYSPKRIIADLTGAFSSPAPGFDAGKLALIGLVGLLLLRRAIK
jgi:hypothetical protein